MKKIIFLKIIIIFFFVTSCGYSPIFSQKEKMFSIAEINSSGDKKLNKIINKKLNFYKNSNSEKNIYLKINTELSKKIASRDQKGNPKTYRIQIISKISTKDNKGKIKNKSFSKSVNYNNSSNKFDLKKYENKTAKNLSEKISEEIIIYLQSI